MEQFLERCDTENSIIWSNIAIELLLTVSRVENSNSWDDLIRVIFSQPPKADVQAFRPSLL